MIKHLPKEDLYQIYETHTLMYNSFRIFYIPKKFFSIKSKNNEYYYFYDINNFLETSLNVASKKYLKDEKLDIVDAKQLNISKEYWRKNLKLIIRYCIYDAKLTKRISDYFWSLMYKSLNFNPKRPFSKGRLAEEYFLSKCYIPTINDIPKFVLEMAWNNFSGGRFELLKRGSFENVYGYDIKSAYPKIMHDLYDINKGKWIKTNYFNKNADLGFYFCKVKGNNIYFSPFYQRLGIRHLNYEGKSVQSSLNIYPNGEFFQYLNNFEINFIRKNFPSCEIQVKKGVEFFLTKEIYPYREEIKLLYEWKEREKDPDIKYCIKILMNAFYGKHIQTVNKRTGKLFNPIYASLITSKTRIKLLEFALENPKNIIAFSTDSLHSTIPMKTKKHPYLGDFAPDISGKGWYIMSDIYSVINDKKRKDKFRGFTYIDDETQEVNKEKTLQYILEEIKDSMIYEYITERPYHLGECLIHVNKKSIEDINIFKKIPKKININGDLKRVWDRDFKNGEDVLNNFINSLPIYIKD